MDVENASDNEGVFPFFEGLIVGDNGGDLLDSFASVDNEVLPIFYDVEVVDTQNLGEGRHDVEEGSGLFRCEGDIEIKIFVVVDEIESTHFADKADELDGRYVFKVDCIALFSRFFFHVLVVGRGLLFAFKNSMGIGRK